MPCCVYKLSNLGGVLYIIKTAVDRCTSDNWIGSTSQGEGVLQRPRLGYQANPLSCPQLEPHFKFPPDLQHATSKLQTKPMKHKTEPEGHNEDKTSCVRRKRRSTSTFWKTTRAVSITIDIKNNFRWSSLFYRPMHTRVLLLSFITIRRGTFQPLYAATQESIACVCLLNNNKLHDALVALFLATARHLNYQLACQSRFLNAYSCLSNRNFESNRPRPT